MTFAKQIEHANSRNVGQFHLFDRGMYQQSSWHSLPVAISIARRNGWKVYNSWGEKVF